MKLNNYFDLPADVLNEFAKGLTNWMKHVRFAVEQGVDDIVELTDLVFYLHNPHRLGRKIEAWEKDAVKEWKKFQNLIRKEFPRLVKGSSKKSKSKSATRAELEKKLWDHIAILVVSLHSFKPEITVALTQLRDRDLYLLAVFGYIRSIHKHGRGIDDLWSWDDSQIAAYKKSPKHKQALADIEVLKRIFNDLPEMKSRSCKLLSKPRVRSLNQQIKEWNGASKPYLKPIGQKLREILLEEMKKPIYPEHATVDSARKLHERLTTGWKKFSLPRRSKATPGFSDHGQMKALDFVVKRGGATVAGAGSPGKWRSGGFDAALRAATRKANKRLGRKTFNGPLKKPDEPWHYDYVA